MIITMSSVNGHNGEASLSMIITTISSVNDHNGDSRAINDHNGDKIY